MAISQAGAERMVRKWQRRLRLKDWTFVVEVGDPDDLEPFANACCEIHEEHRTALITIRPEPVNATLEELVVHELVHVVLVGLPDYTREEQAVWALTSALLA